MNNEMITVALPKGRLGEKAYETMEKVGYPCEELISGSRKLIFENKDKNIRYFWAKPVDVGIYVEKGIADIGIAGKDVIVEKNPDVYELMDLGIGKCKMAVAGKKDSLESYSGPLKVATKFSNIARDYFLSKGTDIEIIGLNGSIELAPILGLSHVIVDIVETGTTLKKNNLEVLEDIMPISARLIANKASYRFKGESIDKMVKALEDREYDKSNQRKGF